MQHLQWANSIQSAPASRHCCRGWRVLLKATALAAADWDSRGGRRYNKTSNQKSKIICLFASEASQRKDIALRLLSISVGIGIFGIISNISRKIESFCAAVVALEGRQSARAKMPVLPKSLALQSHVYHTKISSNSIWRW